VNHHSKKNKIIQHLSAKPDKVLWYCRLKNGSLETIVFQPSIDWMHKNSIKDQWPEPSQGRQKEKAKKTAHRNQIKRERTNPSRGRKLSHSQAL